MRKRHLWYCFTDNLPVIIGALGTIVVLALLVLGIIAAINGIPILNEGTVVDKTYRAAHTEVFMMSISDGKGNSTIYPQTRYYPDKWTVQVSGTTAEDEPRVEWWEVKEALYNRIDIGDRVRRDEQTHVVSILSNIGDAGVAGDASDAGVAGVASDAGVAYHDRKAVAEDAAHDN